MRKIYIYSGPGVSKISLEQTHSSLTSLLGSKYLLENILPTQIVRHCFDDAALFVMPGGADLPYVRSLKGERNEIIKEYVQGGGAFLGICAGSYYGGNFIEFARGSDSEVQGPRELAFFPGTVSGPLLAPYDYQNDSGSRAAYLSWHKDPFTAFYNGGGHFVEADQKEGIQILARYENNEAAVVECQVNLGKAILSAVHIEYDPQKLDPTNLYISNIIDSLREGDNSRLVFFEYLLRRLDLIL